MKNHNLKLEISPEAFCERFDTLIIQDTIIPLESENPFRGKRREERFYFYILPDYRNSWVTVLHGQIQGDSILYRYSKRTDVMIFTGFWVAFVLAFAVFILFIQPLFVFIPIIMTVFATTPLLIKTKKAKKQLKDKLSELCYETHL